MTCSKAEESQSTSNLRRNLEGELIGSISTIRSVRTALILSVVQRYSSYTDAGIWRDELWLNDVVISRKPMQTFVEESLAIGDRIYVGGHYLQSIFTHCGKRRYGRSYLICRQISRLPNIPPNN